MPSPEMPKSEMPKSEMPKSEMLVFDRSVVRHRRTRSLKSATEGDDGGLFLFHEVADRLFDRIIDVARSFDLAIDLTSRDGTLRNQLSRMDTVGTVLSADFSRGSSFQPSLILDEEHLPFREGIADLIISCLSLHWVNDLPGALVQINRTLKPDGLFQGAILGGETLHELRDCLMEAELDVTGGASPRVSPMVDLRDAAGLMQRAGFALPVADLDQITVRYEDPFRLMADLRAMGETNASLERQKHPTQRAVFFRAAELYRDRFGGADGRVPATFDVLFLHGWRPSNTQPKPLRPGSAAQRLADALDTDEQSAGDSAKPKN